MSAVLLFAVGLVSLTLVILAAALLFGGPNPAPAMASINDPFKGSDWSSMPPLSRYPARDGTQLAYRHYGAKEHAENNKVKGSVVLVHGSSASSQSMHKMASAFSQAGYDAYALDIRGHGASGNKGTIAYIGQLEDDLEDFIKSVAPGKPATLVGFSSGGGFVLRVAGSTRQTLFESYLLLSPISAPPPPTTGPTAVAGCVSAYLASSP